MDNDLESMLLKGAEEFGVRLDKGQVDKFFMYMELLKTWNEKVNLTSIKEDRDIIVKHFIDSLSILPYILPYKNSKSSRLIDIGTGAGFPGIPLKIACNELDITLLDSVEKKVKFLEECIDSLKLSKIKAFHGRAEDYGNNPLYREKFDISTARAVANLPVLLEYCLPFVRIGGIFIAMKGKSSDEVKDSMNAMDILGGKIEIIKQITLPFSDNKRNIIIIKKFRQIPAKYPRKAGKPSKMPLI
ncbi:MAG: 16S rRNA (guanine(527)-N(7))-methyltransferase RsmG [Firmicutes bacterium]|nr:16S rRNA (guanine(527)-N(7))-methyltransferase RsmG [Bacillota bacterium]